MIKKYIFILLLLIYLTSCNLAYASGDLYYLRNADIDLVKKEVEAQFLKNNLILVQTEPYVGISYLGDEFAVAILNPDNEGINYYFESTSDSDFNENILNNIQNTNVYISKCFDESITSTYSYAVQAIIAKYINSSELFFNNSKNYTDKIQTKNSNYNFEENQTGSTDKVLKGKVVELPKGTKIHVYIQDEINTSSSHAGDSVIAVLTEDLKSGDYIIAPQGSLVYGNLVKAKNGRQFLSDGNISMMFNEIVTPDGVSFKISAEMVEFNFKRQSDSGFLNPVLLYPIIAVNVVCGTLVGLNPEQMVNDVSPKVHAGIPALTQLYITLNSPLKTMALINF